ncbi:MAG: penicillin-binding protein 2 [Patescibacteria group bacterium]
MSASNPHELFPIKPEEGLGIALLPVEDDVFVEETYSDRPMTGEGSARQFMGSIISPKRFRAIFLFTACLMLLLVGRAGYMQIARGGAYRALAEENRFRSYVIPAERGIITDRNGVILASNYPTFRLISSKELLPSDEGERLSIFQALSQILEVSPEQMTEAYTKATSYQEQIQLAQDISYEDAMRVLAGRDAWSGVTLEVDSERTYTTDQVPTLSHVLGYTGPISSEEYEAYGKEKSYRRFDRVGKMGIESFYEDRLRGIAGEELVEVDAQGHMKRFISRTDPVDGENLTLSIDSELQSSVEAILRARLAGTGIENASVIVMNPKNGEVLSLVSYPAYDANLFVQGMDGDTYTALLEDDANPLFPRATSGEFPSGSTIKPTFAAAALIEGVITPETTVSSTGGLSIGPWFFPDWRAGGHGLTNVYHAIADSVNTFFYMIGGGFEDFKGLGIERLMQWAATFGFGSQSGIDLSGEADGFLPSPEWKEDVKNEVWYIGDTYHVAIGQGDFLATPLQIARSTAVFANGGFLVTPHLLMSVSGNATSIISTDIADIIKTAMRRTITQGSATSLQSLPIEVAGKTGTAQWSTVEDPHSWFTGFGPYDDPQFVVTVLVEKGGTLNLATPIAKDIFEACNNILLE